MTILNKFKSNLARPESDYLDTYHLKNIESNLFDKPYEKIDKRANALRSSAAMIYNTIGPRRIIIGDKEYSHIEYEREFPALNKADKTDHDHDAHLDVSLEAADKSELFLIEAKCLEWLEEPKSMSIAYLSERCYLEETGRNTVPFIKSFRNLKANPEKYDPKDSSRLLPSYNKYDAVQMNIHILGIYNYCARGKGNLPKKIKLMNLVWDYDSADEYRTEEKEGLEYVAFANLYFRSMFKALDVDFSVEYVRYSDFLKQVDWSNDPARREYLKRYEI